MESIGYRHNKVDRGAVAPPNTPSECSPISSPISIRRTSPLQSSPSSIIPPPSMPSRELGIEPPRERATAIRGLLEKLKLKKLQLLPRNEWNLVIKVAQIALAQIEYYFREVTLIETLAGRELKGDKLDHFIWDSLSSCNYRVCFDQRLEEVNQAANDGAETQRELMLSAVAMRVFSHVLDPSQAPLPPMHSLKSLQSRVKEFLSGNIYRNKILHCSHSLEELLLGYIIVGRTIKENC